MKSHPTAGFINLPMLGIIVFLLLATGLGQWLWRSALQIGPACHSLTREVGLGGTFGSTCDTIGLTIASLRNQMERWVGSNTNALDVEQYAGELARQFSSASLSGFNAPTLSGLIRPDLLSGSASSGSSAIEQLARTLSQGSYGTQMLQSGRSDVGLPYLQSSASAGDFGVLSQLSLGSAYLNGTGGISKDAGLSYRYNSMALQSISRLEKSGTPEARRVLSALPASPAEMKRNLSSLLGQIR